MPFISCSIIQYEEQPFSLLFIVFDRRKPRSCCVSGVDVVDGYDDDE